MDPDLQALVIAAPGVALGIGFVLGGFVVANDHKAKPRVEWEVLAFVVALIAAICLLIVIVSLISGFVHGVQTGSG